MDLYGPWAPFYDLDLGGRDDDVLLLSQFCDRCGSPILELGCGTGRLLLPLAREGYRLTGVDSSPAMLAHARRKLSEEGMDCRVTLVEQDMRALAIDERFNLAFCVLNSFMHLPTLEDQLAALDGVFRHLNPGGVLLLDLFNPDLSRLLEPPGQVTLEKVMVDPRTGHSVSKSFARHVNRGEQTIHVTYSLDDVDDEGHVHRTLYSFSLRYLFRAELEVLLRHAGFEVEAVYGSHDLDEFTGESDRIIAVARRPV
jgi:SAM-dependent methyltransferase